MSPHPEWIALQFQACFNLFILKEDAGIGVYFLYFIERNLNHTEYYADIAVNTNQYNVKALVNKGNWFFIKSNIIRSKDIYLEDIVIRNKFFQAIYNLVLANVRLDIT